MNIYIYIVRLKTIMYNLKKYQITFMIWLGSSVYSRHLLVSKFDRYVYCEKSKYHYNLSKVVYYQ